MNYATDDMEDFSYYLSSNVCKRPVILSWKQYGARLQWRHAHFAHNQLSASCNNLPNAAATFTALSFADNGS